MRTVPSSAGLRRSRASRLARAFSVWSRGNARDKAARLSPTVAAAGAAPQLQHRPRQDRQAQREPAPEIGRHLREHREEAVEGGRLLGRERAARPSGAIAGARAPRAYHLHSW